MSQGFFFIKVPKIFIVASIKHLLIFKNSVFLQNICRWHKLYWIFIHTFFRISSSLSILLYSENRIHVFISKYWSCWFFVSFLSFNCYDIPKIDSDLFHKKQFIYKHVFKREFQMTPNVHVHIHLLWRIKKFKEYLQQKRENSVVFQMIICLLWIWMK